MIKNYLKIAIRNLKKHKLYAFTNLMGLTLGMTCFILIAIYVQFELSYDKHHENIDRIFRVVEMEKGSDYQDSEYYPSSPLPLSTAMQNDIPQVETITNIYVNETLLVNKNTPYNEKGLFADSNLFDVFTLELIEGQGKEVLDDPTSIVLTKSLVKKMFKTTDVIGKTILFENKHLMTIRGVLDDPLKNQHFTYDFICSNKIRPQYKADVSDWASSNYMSYVLLKDKYDYKTVESKMLAYNKITEKVFKNRGLPFFPEFSLQPVKDIHLYSDLDGELEANGNIMHVYFFILLAFIILFLASVNYINLATARSAYRSKEVGVFKVLGAKKRNLFFQYLSESIILSLISALFALALAFIILPYFSKLLNKELPFSFLINPFFLLSIFAFALLIGSLSGLFPSLSLSNLNPIKALKGKFVKVYKSQVSFRNILVTGQFIVAIALVAGSIIIYQQIQFIQNKNLGFNKENILHIEYKSNEIAKKEEVIKKSLLSHSNINKISISSYLPINMTSNGLVNNWEGNTEKAQVNMYRTFVDYDFIDLFGIDIIEGRGFSKGFYSDSIDTYILNESAVKKLGWKDAVGKQFNKGVVIGVAKDFHSQPLNLKIEPLYMRFRIRLPNKRRGHIILNVEDPSSIATRDFVINTLKSISPIDIFEIKLLDNTYNDLYDQEHRLGQAFNVFALIAMFLAGMGLFGLVSFQVYERTKEIGVRKVLGSSVYGLVSLLSKTFISLIVIAFFIATPLCYYIMNNWLQNYTYHVEINWLTFLVAGLFTAFIALLTVCTQAIKVALTNPINSLRTE